MDTLKDFFKEEHNRRLEEAAGIMPLGLHVTNIIEKQQATRRKTRWYWWIAGGLVFVLATTGAGLYFRDYVATFFTRIAEIFVQITGNVVDYLKITGTSLAAGLSGARETASSGIIEKATTEVSAWPVQVWYVVFLVAGVALLLGVDNMVRRRKPA